MAHRMLKKVALFLAFTALSGPLAATKPEKAAGANAPLLGRYASAHLAFV